MHFLSMDEALARKDELIQAMRAGKIFIYPTDTIYGIGCHAELEKPIATIRALKSREEAKPFSCIAPSKEWISLHFRLHFPEWLDQLPGPYTLILEKKRRPFMESLSPTPTLGVRIPDHAFTKLVQAAQIPFVTTSVNLAGEKPAQTIRDIPESMLKGVDYVIDAGKLDNPPSELWDLTKEKPTLIPRKPSK